VLSAARGTAPHVMGGHRSRRAPGLGGLTAVLGAVLAAGALAGCSQSRMTVAEALPAGTYASPWVRDGPVWSGPPAEVWDQLGAEAETWRELEPQRVWLAVYRHDTRPDNTLTVRVWAFATAEQACQAYLTARPAAPQDLHAGDAACWTADGILVHWGRMVFDIFGSGPSRAASPEQAVYLWAVIEKQMPAGLPRAPR